MTNKVQKAPKAPRHLLPATRKWWAQVMGDFELESHHVRLLSLAAEAWDRCAEARERLQADGCYIEDRFGTLKAHPAVAVERDSRVAFCRCLRELNLDIDSPADPRAPGLRTGYERRS